MKTSNLYFAAGAVSYGAIVPETEEEGRKIIFCLENCPDEVFIYLNGKVQVEYIRDFEHLFHLYTSRCLMFTPSYPNSLKDLKALIHDR